ncbi:TRAP transporter small permease [Roseomonas sp. E05]|uniref:TRAP transporter small permease subunit n=1 Tax=Roseomonas sp. E05 TaxID=3046310 RepID=UPI0024BA944F|nr:TRAP transporter small permease [Roseomonas sp. E05]MDJ0390585.1 TRAP transporter small permease [Roseomonas sp. E05]
MRRRVPAALAAARGASRALAVLSTLMAYVAGWNYILCAAFITFDILARSFFGFSSTATVEVTSYMLAGGIAWSLGHTLVRRAHIRVDVMVNRMPLRLRAGMHLVALLLLDVFAAICALAGWQVVEESLLFNAHDNSGLHLPLVLPQGIWTFGLAAFCLMVTLQLAEGVLAFALVGPEEVERMLGSRTADDETREALEAAAMGRVNALQEGAAR